MARIFHLELSEFDLGQLLDGLEARAGAWETTADYHRAGVSPKDFIVEECSNADETDRIAVHCRSIISKIHQQREVQL